MPMPLPVPPIIAYQDQAILVIHKPAGWPVQPDKTGAPDLLSWLEQTTGPGPFYLVHRLDRPVSGLIVVARRPAGQSALTRQMARGQFSKRYLAVVCAHPAADQGDLTDYLQKNERLNLSQVVSPDARQAKQARLHYRCLQRCSDPSGQPLSLLAIDLETGRHHQIRVQMAHAGWPLWGDSKYNPARTGRSGWQAPALLAWQLTFIHPADGRRLRFTAGFPAEFPWTLFSPPVTGEIDR